MMNNQARSGQPETKKKKSGKQRPNMMSNQGPGEDASTGSFAKQKSTLGIAGGFGARARTRNPNKKRINPTMGGITNYGNK